jgi:hypothetical protein
MTSTRSAGIQRHFWQSSQHTHAARGSGTDATSILHATFPGKSVDTAPEFLSPNSVAGSILPMKNDNVNYF